MVRALRAEFMKLRRSRVVLGSAILMVVFATAGMMYMWMLRDPARASQSGVTALHGVFFSPTWKALLAVNSASMAASWGVMLFGLAASYLFGREYTEGTAKLLLTSPVRRMHFMAAKFIVLALWVATLAALSIVLQAAVALGMHLDGFSWRVLAEGTSNAFLVAVLQFAALPIICWLAMLGKGYLPPMGASVAGWVLATAFSMSKWAKWYPWAIPHLVTGTIWAPQVRSDIPAVSWLVLLALFAVGVALSVRQFVYADNTQ